MNSSDNCVSIVPYFQVHEGKMEAFQALCEEFTERTKSEEKALYYGFVQNGDIIHCREGYIGADGAIAHLENVGDLVEKALTISDLIKFEIHGQKDDVDKLKEPLKDFDIDYFEYICGFRK